MPSFAALNTTASIQIQAAVGADILNLPEIPGRADTPLTPESSWARASIDCLEIRAPIPELCIRFIWPETAPPERFLATVSARPASLPTSAPATRSIAPIACASYSQMTLSADVAQRSCSPVSLAMTLLPDNPGVDVTDLVAECRHPASGLYGVWPMAIRAAAKRGKLVSVEASTSFDSLIRALCNHSAVIASIRFEAGELSSAPLAKTGGHLIVVRGIQDGHVIVHDPAAPDHQSVLRRYAIDQFARAWLAERGVAYFFASA